jgi:thiosulfate/3-mercaptopyruvate sulfurtransferase
MALPSHDLLIAPKELAAGTQDRARNIQILDTRPAEQFAAGRIPGAIHLELWGLSLNDSDPEPLRAFLYTISHYLTTRGLDPKRPVVVYEQDSGMRAARAFWFLEYFGHPDVRLLDGGFTAWTAAGLPVETGAATPPPPNDPERDPDTVSKWPDDGSTERREEIAAGWREVFAAAGAQAHRKDLTIVDARSPDERSGATVRAKRPGFIPCSIHIEYKDALNADGTFKARDELRRLYESNGVTPDHEVITYCQGGYRSAHSYLALRLLGYPRVRNYVASWAEWGNREELPVEDGQNKKI